MRRPRVCLPRRWGLTAAEAVTKARAATPGTVTPGTVTAVEIDDDSTWTVEINDRDHTVHPATGRVILDKDDD